MRKALRCALVLVAWLIAARAPSAAEAPRAGSVPAAPPAPSTTQTTPSLPTLDKTAQPPPEDMSAPADYDEVVRDLIEQILNKRDAAKSRDVLKTKRKKEDEDRDLVNEKEQFTINAQDAARKLASLGKRAVPDLTLLLKANYNRPAKQAGAERAAQVAYYAVWALARIRTADAARALMPLMADPATPRELRLIAVDAAGWEKSAEGIAVLEKAATADSDLEMRKKALGQLAMIPENWPRSEPIFVKALSDSNEDIRVQAAKACHFSHMFASANPKLIELLEKDPVASVRMYAMLTVARLKVVKAEAALVRVLQQSNLDEKLRKQALMAITAISGIPFRNVESVLAWWDKTGQKEFENFAQNAKLPDERAVDTALQRPVKLAPKTFPAGSEEALTGASGTAAEIISAEVVPLEKAAVKEVPVVETPAIPVKAAEPPPVVFINPPDELLSPKESSGSQRRRLRKQE